MGLNMLRFGQTPKDPEREEKLATLRSSTAAIMAALTEEGMQRYRESGLMELDTKKPDKIDVDGLSGKLEKFIDTVRSNPRQLLDNSFVTYMQLRNKGEAVPLKGHVQERHLPVLEKEFGHLF